MSLFFAHHFTYQYLDNQRIKMLTKKYVKSNCCIIRTVTVYLFHNSLSVTLFGGFELKKRRISKRLTASF